MSTRLALGALLAAALLATPLLAETWQVPGDFETVQAAVDAAGPGGTILVSLKTVDEAILIEEADGLELRAKGKVTIDPGGGTTAIAIDDSSDVTIRGFAITNATHGVRIANSPGCRVEKREVRNVAQVGIYAISSDGARVSKCELDNTGGHGVMVASDGNTLEKDKVSQSALDGLQVSGSSNTFTKVKVSKSVGFDLSDTGVDNTYSGSKIGTIDG